MKMEVVCMLFCFFFQAEDGIRDTSVTGVQTCALPIFADELGWWIDVNSMVLWEILAKPARNVGMQAQNIAVVDSKVDQNVVGTLSHVEIGRASCRERV